MSRAGNAAQMQARLTKTADPGVGAKYEVSVATLVAATLSNNEKIESYHVFTNLEEAYPFDDVVAKVFFKGDDAPYAFAMQLKHVGKGETLDVEKYLKGYSKIFNAGGFKTAGNIGVANIHFCYFCINKVQKADYYTLHKHGGNNSESWRSTLSISNCHILTYNKPISETGKYFLDNFHLYLYQPNINKIKEDIKTLCKIKDVSGILNYVDRFFEKGELWKGGLSKEVFETELLKVRLSSHILPLTDVIPLHNSPIEIWNDLILQHNITIVAAEMDIEKSLYGCCEQTLNRLFNNLFDWDTCRSGPLDPQIINEFKKLFKTNNPTRVRHWIDPPTTLESLILELWKCGDLPLILRSDDELPVLKDYAHLHKSYVVITKNTSSKREEYERYQLRVFSHVSDLKCLEMRDQFLKTISISLQGRKPMTLQSIINYHDELTETLSCSDIIHLMKSRIEYLSKECLDGDNNMIFLIEDPTSTAKYSIDAIRKVGGNVSIRCRSEEVITYRKQIEKNPSLQGYEIYYCVTSSKNENLTLVEGNKSLLRDFFIDQDGECIYVLGANPVPIIGPSLKSIQPGYIPRLLRGAVLSKSIFDSQTRGVYFFSGNCSYLEASIRKCLVEAPKYMKFDNRNIFIKVNEEDVDKYWLKASRLKCPLLHICVEGSDMHLHKSQNWVGLSDHILYNGREISEANVLTEMTDGITILTGEPGIGKSCLLQSLCKTYDTVKYILFYSLVDYGRFLEKENLVPTNISLDFLLDRSKNKRYREFLSALFKRKDRVLVLLDSFDEVLPIHKENVLHFIRNLAANKVQIIIASRIIANNILMSNFDTRILKVDFLRINDCKEYIRNCKLNEEVLTTVPNEFSQNPLYLKLLKTIYENNGNLEGVSKFSLFQNVIDIKMEQYFQKYFSGDHIPNREHYLKPVRELHFQLALMRILGAAVVKTVLQLEDTNKLTNELKLGLVLSIDEGEYPTFVHETFAEHLTADWIVRNKTKDSAKKIYQEMKKQNKLYILDVLCEQLELHKAVLAQNIEEVTVLARDCKHLERTDAVGRMAIHVAAAHQPNALWSAIDIIICSMRKFKANLTDSDALMQWNWVQHSYQTNVIEYMLDNIISTPVWEAYVNCIAQKSQVDSELYINLFDDNGITEMYETAIIRDSVNMIRDLLFFESVKLNGVSKALEIDMLHVRNIRKLTALHVACIYGNVEGVRKLINWKHINAVDSFGCTPLHYSVMNPPEMCIDMTQLLLKGGSKVYIQNNFGKTATNIAVCSGNFHIAKLLLQKSNKKEDLLNLLLLAVDPVADTRITKSSTHTSGEINLDIVRLLFEKGADVNGTGKHGKTPLMFASERGNLDIVKLLLEKGANVNGATSYGKTPLMFASGEGNLDTVRLLLEKSAEVNGATSYGKTPLMFASGEGNLDIVKLLLEKGADVDSRTKDCEAPLIFASARSNLDIAKILLQRGANVNGATSSGKTPLMFASEEGSLGIVKLLLENGADLNNATEDGETPLTFASGKNSSDIVKILLEGGANVNGATSFGKTPLMFASGQGNLDMVNTLLREGANVNNVTPYGNTPIMFASESGNLDIVKILLENGANVNGATSYGKTSLMFASEKDNVDVVKMLLDKGADVNGVTSHGKTPLMFASGEGNLDIVKILLERDANVDSITTNRKTPLMFAAEAGALDTARILLESGAYANSSTVHGETPLIFASGGGNLDIVEMLLEIGANVNGASIEGYTPLMCASERGYLNIVSTLLKRGANVYSRTTSDKTALTFAYEEGHMDVVDVLSKLDENTILVEPPTYRSFISFLPRWLQTILGVESK